MRRQVRTLMLTMAAMSSIVLMGGCAATKEVAMATPGSASACLPNPSLLQQGKTGQVDQVYLNPSVNWSSYNKMILEPVTIWSGPGSNMDKAPPKAQKALADGFYTNLYDAVSKKCQMVRQPGPGTMQWRIALVDATSANPFLNTLSTYEPHVHLLDVLAGYAFDDGTAYWVGQATAEGYAKDSMTGALLWEGQDKRVGTKNIGRDTFKSWDDVDNALKAWAADFAKRLGELGACRQG